MTTPTAFSLPTETREAAERSLGCELPGVLVSVGPLPVAVGALAVTWGRHVVLSPCVGGLPTADVVRVLGHELAHVAQQECGRVVPSGRLLGLPFSNCGESEAEADAAGARLASGVARRRWRRLSGKRCPRPVLQRLVSLGGRALSSPADLAPEVGSVVSMIRGASRWLQWATSDPVDNYAFEDGPRLVAGIQDGLHGSPWMLLPRLEVMASPVRLLELEPNELATLASYEAESSAGVATDLQVKKILSENDLVSQGELEVGLDFLEEMGLRADAVFQALSLADQIELFKLVDGAQTEAHLDEGLQKEASSFAVANATQPLEFIDLYRFYMTFLERELGGKSAGQRSNKAQTLLDGLSQQLYGQLRGPTIDRAPSLDELGPLLQGWLPIHGSVGYKRISAAVNEVLRESAVLDPSGENGQKAVAEVLQATQSFLLTTPPTASTVAQDGWSRRYLSQSDAGRAVLAWDKTGLLTLELFSRAPAAPAGDETASPKKGGSG